jgi:hypothetical protein
MKHWPKICGQRHEPIDYAVLNQHERTVRRLRISPGLDRPPPPPPPPSYAAYERKLREAAS